MRKNFPQHRFACWKSSISQECEEGKGFPVFVFLLPPNNSVILAQLQVSDCSIIDLNFLDYIFS